MTAFDVFLLAFYALVVGLLAVFAGHRVHLALRHRRARRMDGRRRETAPAAVSGRPSPGTTRDSAPEAPGPSPLEGWAAPPAVLVQVPVYNEAAVVERIIDAVCALDWPRERLEIQILDDSTDETRDLASRLVAAHRSRGVPVRHLRRSRREGFKAGALAAGLEAGGGEFVAIFDADFVPPRDFLRRVMPAFVDPEVGMVQARWGHLNRGHSLLTRLQALLLDGHFEIEHLTRHRTGLFFNFNGTGGVWRRACIEAAGGWQHDTLTEDLDLSYRAQLAGWRFVYLDDVVVPAEVPTRMRAFKSQQHRWTKGAVQTGRKLLGRIWRAPIPLRTRVEAGFHLLDHHASALVFLFSVVIMPALLLRRDHLPAAPARFIGAGFLLMSLLALGVFYGSTLAASGKKALRRLWLLPFIVPLIAGLGLTTLSAVFEGHFGKDLTFVRTPKSGGGARDRSRGPRYAAPGHPMAFLELPLAVYHGVLAVMGARAGWYAMSVFYALFCLGFCWVGLASLFEDGVRRDRRARLDTVAASASRSCG